ncbi:NDR1/HIN1-like protein 13 [Eucalyptus grandis]|uniref:NDR1/HIN1-like protein 13 n=1 Tax=Eucalyptus grandis TaxID=71139 RepID=UPI00192ECE86|nr:NDR1/HIN1-like protein 13 [Eucalyptus grandis]
MSYPRPEESNPHFRPRQRGSPPPHQLVEQPSPEARFARPLARPREQFRPPIQEDPTNHPPYALHPRPQGLPQPPRSPAPQPPPPRREKPRRKVKVVATPQPAPSPPSSPVPQDEPHHPLHTPGPRASSPPLEESRPQPPQGQPGQPTNLRFPPAHKTKFLTWCLAAFCAIFWVVIIIGGLIVLIVYLVFRPHLPKFEISSATLNAAYLDMGTHLNADMTLLANFTNANRKVRNDFSYVILDLYYGGNPIATQYINPFSTTRLESRLASVHMVSSQVRLPSRDNEKLKKQLENNALLGFELRGVVRVKSKFGSFLRYSYWLYTHCTIILTGPPTGVLKQSHCQTKR